MDGEKLEPNRDPPDWPKALALVLLITALNQRLGHNFSRSKSFSQLPALR